MHQIQTRWMQVEQLLQKEPEKEWERLVAQPWKQKPRNEKKIQLRWSAENLRQSLCQTLREKEEKLSVIVCCCLEGSRFV